jgi:hypothetical protein
MSSPAPCCFGIADAQSRAYSQRLNNRREKLSGNNYHLNLRRMEVEVKIVKLKTVNHLDNYWQQEDYIKLLEEFDYPKGKELKEEERLDFLFLAIADFEPAEAAEIILKYKMSDKLSDGQIQNLAHEMLIEKVAEQYPEPAYHYDLFNINQLLRKAYNGKFPETEALVIKARLRGENVETDLSEERLLKSLSAGLRDSNLILRLFGDQVAGSVPFGDAAKVIWDYHQTGDSEVEIITSQKWIEKEDFEKTDFKAELAFFSEE